MGQDTPYKQPEEIVIEGIVSPSGWDDQGNVQALCIATTLDKYYYIDMGKGPHDFMGYLKKFVEARGTVRTHGGVNRISISSIQITRNPDWDESSTCLIE